jgi:hypothetical protein
MIEAATLADAVRALEALASGHTPDHARALAGALALDSLGIDQIGAIVEVAGILDTSRSETAGRRD